MGQPLQWIREISTIIIITMLLKIKDDKASAQLQDNFLENRIFQDVEQRNLNLILNHSYRENTDFLFLITLTVDLILNLAISTFDSVIKSVFLSRYSLFF